MRQLTVLFLAVCVLSACGALAQTEEEPSFVEVEQFPPLPLATVGYIPTSTPFDNPSNLIKPVDIIPSVPDCTVRPQTVVEIHRMRAAASHIAQAIHAETAIMAKRKAYIEQMTSYINDRIRELNRVKGELEQETRWIQISNQRISELAEKEKLIKYQDILSCVKMESQRLSGATQSTGKSAAELQKQTQTIEASIAGIKKNIDNLKAGGAGAAGGAAAGAGADAGAAAGAPPADAVPADALPADGPPAGFL